MKTTGKTISATISTVLVLLLTVGLLNGFGESMDGRWALGAFGIFIIVGVTSLLTGSDSMMKHDWSRYGLYVLAAALFIVTFVNAFIDSQAWFVASAGIALLMYIEYLSTTYIATRGRTSSGPTNRTPHAMP